MAIEAVRKVSRGQVWFLVDNDVPAVHTNGSVQGKNRPCLVVSNNMCNQTSPVWTVVPLTSQIKNNLPTHVEFDVGDKHNTILCEQIRPVSAQAFFNTGSYYKYTLSENTMALVDEALAAHLGLSLVFPNSDRFWESLERLIRTRVKQAITDTKVDALDISKVVTLLDTKVDEIIKGEVSPTPVIEEATAEEPQETVEQDSGEDKEEPVKKRRKWTLDEKREFLDYYAINGAKKTAEYYGMKIGSVHTSRFNFYKELNK